jgi:hypothetical protein
MWALWEEYLELRQKKGKKEKSTQWRASYYVDLFFTINQIKEDEMGEVCSTHEDIKNACVILVENTERKKPLGGQTVD